jgi:predicted RNA-binding protein YlqC (UPF0109 family)
MVDLKKTLHDIAAAIVDQPEEIRIEQTEEDDTITLVLTVAPDDMGLVIGKHGKIAKAIRLLMKAAGSSSNKRINIEIK